MYSPPLLLLAPKVIYLDESPPPLYLLTVYGGTLRFADWAGDLSLNASYVFVFGGKLIVGTEASPFPPRAVITVTCALPPAETTQRAQALARSRLTSTP